MMKLPALLIVALVGFSACENADTGNKATADTANYTTIKWIDSIKSIGTVAAGKKTEISFAFENTGAKPLFIISAKPGCGCTVADYPKEAIAPGAKGVITASYAAPASGAGEFRKNITVTTNTKGASVHRIFFYGDIRKEGDSTKTDRASAKARA